MGKLNINFEYSSNSDEIMSFIGTQWKENHILSSNKELFDWQYKGPNNYNFVVAKDKKKIIGILGFIPNKKYDREIIENIIWLALWKVNEYKKYVGVGTRLLLKLINDNPDSVVAVNGIEDNVLKIYESFGFQIGSLKQFYILNPNIDSRLIVGSTPYSFKENENLVSELYGSFENLNGSLDDLKESLFIKFNRYKSKNFLQERYLNNPFYDYHFFLFKCEDYESLIIIREINANSDEKILRVIDFIGDPNSIKFIARFLYRFILDNNYSYIDFLIDGIDQQILFESGFYLSSKDSFWLPNYYEPLSMEFVNINTAIKLKNKEKFMILKGDGDQDRPNLL